MLTTQQLHALLSLTPRLSKLELERVEGFDAFAFLQPVRSTLRQLVFDDCCYTRMATSFSDLLTLRTLLPQLTHLEVRSSFDLSCAEVTLLTPPSTALPTLQSFVYKETVQRGCTGCKYSL